MRPIWASCTAHHSTDTRLHIYPYTCIQILHAFFMFFMVWGTGHDFAIIALNYLNSAHNLCVELHNYGKEKFHKVGVLLEFDSAGEGMRKSRYSAAHCL